MLEDKLLEKFLEEIEQTLYEEKTINNANIAEYILRILEKEYDI